MVGGLVIEWSGFNLRRNKKAGKSANNVAHAVAAAANEPVLFGQGAAAE